MERESVELQLAQLKMKLRAAAAPADLAAGDLTAGGLAGGGDDDLTGDDADDIVEWSRLTPACCAAAARPLPQMWRTCLPRHASHPILRCDSMY